MYTLFRTAGAASLQRAIGTRFKNESQDGYDAVEWAAALPYSNGKVGLVGMSYVGVTQMLAAIATPPHLAGIMPVITGSNYHENWTYQGGALAQSFDQGWSTYFAADALDRRALKATPPPRRNGPSSRRLSCLDPRRRRGSGGLLPRLACAPQL